MGDILLSRAVMSKLGYDPKRWLEQACVKSDVYILEDVEASGSAICRMRRVAENRGMSELAPEEKSFQSDEEESWFQYLEDKSSSRSVKKKWGRLLPKD